VCVCVAVSLAGYVVISYVVICTFVLCVCVLPCPWLCACGQAWCSVQAIWSTRSQAGLPVCLIAVIIVCLKNCCAQVCHCKPRTMPKRLCILTFIAVLVCVYLTRKRLQHTVACEPLSRKADNAHTQIYVHTNTHTHTYTQHTHTQILARIRTCTNTHTHTNTRTHTHMCRRCVWRLPYTLWIRTWTLRYVCGCSSIPCDLSSG